jgi:hypothetical protein
MPEAYALKRAEGLKPAGSLETVGSSVFYIMACRSCSAEIGKLFTASENSQKVGVILMNKAAVRTSGVVITPASPTGFPPQLVNLAEETSSLVSSAEHLEDPLRRFDERLNRLESKMDWLIEHFQRGSLQ